MNQKQLLPNGFYPVIPQFSENEKKMRRLRSKFNSKQSNKTKTVDVSPINIQRQITQPNIQNWKIITDYYSRTVVTAQKKDQNKKEPKRNSFRITTNDSLQTNRKTKISKKKSKEPMKSSSPNILSIVPYKKQDTVVNSSENQQVLKIGKQLFSQNIKNQLRNKNTIKRIHSKYKKISQIKINNFEFAYPAQNLLNTSSNGFVHYAVPTCKGSKIPIENISKQINQKKYKLNHTITHHIQNDIRNTDPGIKTKQIQFAQCRFSPWKSDNEY